MSEPTVCDVRGAVIWFSDHEFPYQLTGTIVGDGNSVKCQIDKIVMIDDYPHIIPLSRPDVALRVIDLDLSVYEQHWPDITPRWALDVVMLEMRVEQI